MHVYILTALVVFLAGFVQGTAGFGFAVVSMSLLTLFLSIKVATPLVALLGLLNTFIIFYYMRRHLDLSKIRPLFTGAFFGIPTGVFLLTSVDEWIIKIILAVTLLGYALFSLVGKGGGYRLGPLWGYIFGFVSGCLGGAFNTNGPPIVVYASLQNWKKEDITITLQSYFIASGVVIIAMHSVQGLINWTIIKYFIGFTPFLLTGTFIGLYLYSRIEQDLFKKIIFFLLIILSLVLLYKQLIQFI